jgi:hypothetical protein
VLGTLVGPTGKRLALLFAQGRQGALMNSLPLSLSIPSSGNGGPPWMLSSAVNAAWADLLRTLRIPVQPLRGREITSPVPSRQQERRLPRRTEELAHRAAHRGLLAL